MSCYSLEYVVLPGGLGDVMGALPKALSRRGHRVMVVAPRYGEYAEGWETGVRRQMRVFNSDQEVLLTLTGIPMHSSRLMASKTILLICQGTHFAALA